MSTDILKNIPTIPPKPGVYLFKNAANDILYIGKAKQLKNRVKSYFQKSASLAPDKQTMVSKIKKVEYIITSSETEALLLESSLIKKHQPLFNIDLKDDKYFLFIKITLNEDYPRVFTVRRVLNDKAKYFGPYVSTISVRQTLHFLRKLFPHRNFPNPPAPHHLRYLTKRYPELLGPQDKAEYRQTIERIIKFLKGHYEDILKDLKQKMVLAAGKKQFEKAAGYRDKIRAIEKVMERQKVISAKKENQDILSLAREESQAAINLFAIRQGKLISKQNFLLTKTSGQTNGQILQTFIERFYPQHTNLPTTLVVPTDPPNTSLIIKAFGCKIIVPRRGVKKQYLELGHENAKNYLEQQKASWEKNHQKIHQALLELKKYLQLPSLPKRIETYDISNIQGKEAVGSMAVFTNGQPDKKWYRKFKIKTVASANDPAMMAEIIKRRFDHLGGKKDKTNWPQPDLIILDGGQGQLNIVLKTLKIKLPIMAVAKKQEDIYLPEKKKPINFPKNSAALHLIQRMRDEAHRFAVTFFRTSHRQQAKKSQLDEVPGLGPKKKKLLMDKFGSVEKIRQASEKKLTSLVGGKLAAAIKDFL